MTACEGRGRRACPAAPAPLSLVHARVGAQVAVLLRDLGHDYSDEELREGFATLRSEWDDKAAARPRAPAPPRPRAL